MSFEIIPLLADWLKDASYGVNALLPTVPRDGSDPLPPAVTVCDEMRDGWIARTQIAQEKVPAGQPVLAVFQSGEATYPSVKMQRAIAGGAWIEGEANYLIMYMQRESDSVKAALAARYTLRAALSSLLLMHDPKSGAARERNGASLVGPKAFQMSTLHEERGDVLVTGGILAGYQVREIVQLIP